MKNEKENVYISREFRTQDSGPGLRTQKKDGQGAGSGEVLGVQEEEGGEAGAGAAGAGDQDGVLGPARQAVERGVIESLLFIVLIN